MRFRLVEDVSPNLGDYGNDWQQFEENGKLTDAFLKDLIKKYAGIDTNSKKFFNLVKSSIDAFGFDPQENQFLSYLITAKNNGVDIDTGKTDNLQVISDRALSGQDINKEWYYNSELLKRPYQEFTYVLNIADVLSNSRKASRYFNDIKNKGVKEIFADGDVSVNGKIKDAGIGSRDKNTIFGMINQWTKDDAKEERKPTIKDILDQTFKDEDFVNGEEYIQKLVDIATDSNDGNIKALSLPLGEISRGNAKQIRDLLLQRVDGDSLDDVFVLLLKRIGPSTANKNDTNNKKG